MKFAIDLSRGSARAIGITKRVGTALVAVYKMNNEVTHE
jgi:rare lipoprotein A (peptidoglycan hydrolase)